MYQSEYKAIEGVGRATLKTLGQQSFEVEACGSKDNDTLSKMVNYKETSIDKDNTVNHK